jgi:phage/plasmid-associated DNA primase
MEGVFMTQHNDDIGDEAIYLRINQLQKGLLQFTDSTNAERLLREHGSDIRYIAPWKKWVVWDDTHWQVDTGALLYTKQLEMVRWGCKRSPRFGGRAPARFRPVVP